MSCIKHYNLFFTVASQPDCNPQPTSFHIETTKVKQEEHVFEIAL